MRVGIAEADEDTVAQISRHEPASVVLVAR
jgi:hypothetical protein